MSDASEPVSAFAVYSQINEQNKSHENKRKKEYQKTKAKKQKLNNSKKPVTVNDRGNNKPVTVNDHENNKPKKNKSKKALEIRNEINEERKIDDIEIDNTTEHENQNQKNDSPVQISENIEDTSSVPAHNGIDDTQEIEIFKTPNIEDYEEKTKNKKKKLKIKHPSKNQDNPFLTNSSSGYFYVDNFDSIKTGEKLFSWILDPLEVTDFFRENWEKQPVIIDRKCPDYYSHILSCQDIDRALRKKQLFFTKNIDITSYTPATGIRETHNPPGRATAPLVWDFYSNGCSIRILNPQTFFPKVHALLAALQEYFECFVGANVYLTPADTQGFAPHFDDIEAFVIQLEGEKLWRLYAPRNPSEVLPRYSSGNFTNADLGEPIKEVLLKAGDMMYFPRGFIHQGLALENKHSLHITLSVYQKNSWADFLETLLPAALKSAIEEDVSFREGLPMHFLSNVGMVHSEKKTYIRAQFMEKLQTLMTKLIDHAPIDAAADQLGKKFIHDSLPPILRCDEKDTTVFNDGERIRNGVIKNQGEMCLATKIKLIRYNCIRMLREEDSIRIYYNISNSKEYHGEEPQFLEIDEDFAPVIDALIFSYPLYITVENLPLDDDIAKVQIASDLWENGILKTESPLSYESD